MALPSQNKLTPQEYLEIERRAEMRSEYFAGRVYAMAGVDRRHDLIAGNFFASLHAQFRERTCVVHSADMRVKVTSAGLYTYPDLSALCGEARYEDEHVDTLVNPSVIVEVLSKSTEAYDRGDKFAHYRSVESIMDYVLVSQDRVRVEHFVRLPDNRWVLSTHQTLDDSVDLSSVGARVSLADIYLKVAMMPTDDLH